MYASLCNLVSPLQLYYPIVCLPVNTCVFVFMSRAREHGAIAIMVQLRDESGRASQKKPVWCSVLLTSGYTTLQLCLNRISKLWNCWNAVQGLIWHQICRKPSLQSMRLTKMMARKAKRRPPAVVALILWLSGHTVLLLMRIARLANNVVSLCSRLSFSHHLVSFHGMVHISPKS